MAWLPSTNHSMRKHQLTIAVVVIISTLAVSAYAQVGGSSVSLSGAAAPEIATSSPSVALRANPATAHEIAALEDAYYARFGRYLQIMPGNKMPRYPSASVVENFGASVADDVQVDVYESPHGAGYQISYDSLGTRYTVGYGPEAAARTYSRPLSAPVATSTTGVAEQF